ncbi:MAG TPA: glycosyltransferase family 2 protein [Patescibacteria group bacterium]
MREKFDVSVVIPNWNGEKLLPKTLQSLQKQKFKNFDTIVVDNGSTDGSVRLLLEKFPRVKIIALEKNYGFAKAVNFAVIKLQNKYVALLNNDAIVDKNWLYYLLLSLKKHKDCYASTPIMIDPKTKKVENAGDKINVVGQAHPRGVGEEPKKYFKKEFVFGASGGASLFKKDVLEKLGLFDEKFFFYFEDVDLALRAQLAGYKVIFDPRAIVYHKGGRSAKKIGKRIEYFRFRHTIYLTIKNLPGEILFSRRRWLKIPLVWLHTFFYFVKTGLGLEALMVAGSVLFNLPSLLKDRSRILKSRKIKIGEFDKLFEDKSLKIGKWQI